MIPRAVRSATVPPRYLWTSHAHQSLTGDEERHRLDDGADPFVAVPGIHRQCAADRARHAHGEFETRASRRESVANYSGQDDPGSRTQALIFQSMPLEVSPECQDSAVIAVVRGEYVAALAQHAPRDALLGEYRCCRGQIGDGIAVDQQRSRTADPVGRMPGHQLVATHQAAYLTAKAFICGGYRHRDASLSSRAASARTSSGPTVVTSPAPIVMTRSPSRTRALR